MNTTGPAPRASHPAQPRWAVRCIRLAAVLGLLALVLLAVAGPGYRAGVLPLGPALLGAAAGFLIFIPVFLIGCIGLVALWRGSRTMPRVGIAVTLLGAIISVACVVWIVRLRAAPPIHDISTDLEQPPTFKDVLPLRAASDAVNPPDYRRVQTVGGRQLDVSDAQRRAYPELRPLVLNLDRTQAMHLAEQAARGFNWDIVAVVPAEGRLEATDTTRYFGFKDDIVVRVREENSGSRIDVRSESRVGLGDAGTNAQRVAAYLAKLRQLPGDAAKEH
jgi:uncharacterized protein (DUF1499 family)